MRLERGIVGGGNRSRGGSERGVYVADFDRRGNSLRRRFREIVVKSVVAVG